MLHLRPAAVWGAVLIILLIIIFSSASHYAFNNATSHKGRVFSLTGHVSSGFDPDIDRVGNGTLGFEKIFVIGMPERSDKRDALALTSSLTELKLHHLDGVKGDTVPDKAVPFGTDRETLWESNLGSWRSHMNAVREIIENGYSSALIMEDDVDWDVRLKQQLRFVVPGTRFIQERWTREVSNTVPHSPYGDDWDLIWLGHCGEVFPEDLDENKGREEGDPILSSISTKYRIDNDMTLPPADKLTSVIDYHTENPNTRWIHQSGGPICSFAYALSNRGAHKVLFDLSVDHLLGAFDNALANLCRYGSDPDRLGMRCVSVTPTLFFHHKAKGRISGDSDIQKIDAADNVREVGFTENIAWSARNNIKNMLMGWPMESQFHVA